MWFAESGTGQKIPRQAGLQTQGAQVCKPTLLGLQPTPGVCNLTMPHQTNLLFFVARSVDPGERVCNQASGSASLQCLTKHCNSQ